MRRNPELNQFRAVFTAADAGVFDLPEDLDAIRRGLVWLEAHERTILDASAAALTAKAEYHAELRAAALSGASAPSTTKLGSALSDVAVAREAQLVTADLVDRLQSELISGLSDVERLVLESLRPAFEETLAAARVCVDAIGDWGDDAEAMMRAPAEAQKAWMDLGPVVERYGSLRTVHRALVPLSPPSLDTDGRFAIATNLGDVWPQWHQPQWRSPAPWPAEARAAMIWQLRHGVDLWLPIAAEQDELWAKSFPDAPVIQGRHPLNVAAGRGSGKIGDRVG